MNALAKESRPKELEATVPDYQIPFVTIIEKGEHPFAMFKNFPEKFYWIFPPLAYESKDELVNGFKKIFIDRAYEIQKKLFQAKGVVMEVKTVEEFLQQKTN